MAYDLDGMTLAMEGTPLALTEDDDFGIQTFALVTIGVVICPLLVDEEVFENASGIQYDRERILREDDLIFKVIMAFMELRRWH